MMHCCKVSIRWEEGGGILYTKDLILIEIRLGWKRKSAARIVVKRHQPIGEIEQTWGVREKNTWAEILIVRCRLVLHVVIFF